MEVSNRWPFVSKTEAIETSLFRQIGENACR
jgi:hypothetical protein